MKKNLIFRRAEQYLPLILAAVGLLLRLEYLREYSGELPFDTVAGADVIEYDQRAKEIIAGEFLPAVPDIHAPLYGFFLALCYKLTGFSIPLVRLIQLLLNWGSFLALEKLLARKGTAYAVRMVFLACSMLYTVPFFHSAELISESILPVFFTLALWLLELADCSFDPLKRALRTAGAGAACGLAALTHALTLPFAVLVFGYTFFTRQKKEALVFLAGVLLMILPAAAVKSLYYGKFCGIQENGGFNFFLGNNPAATGGCYLRPGMEWRKVHADARKQAEQRNISTDRVHLEKSLSFFINSPFKALGLFIRKAAMVWAPWELIAGADPGGIIYAATIITAGGAFTLLLFFFCWYGIVLAWKQPDRKLVHFYLLGIAMYAGMILTVTSGRYRFSMLIPVLLLAATAMVKFNWKQFAPLVLLLAALGGAFALKARTFDPFETAAIRSEAALKKGDLQQAEQLICIARSGIFDPARFDNQLGMIRERQGNFAAAEKFYRSALAGEPDYMDSSMNLANLLGLFPERKKEAERYFSRAFGLKDDSSMLCYNYAVFLLRYGNVPEAERFLRRAIECDPYYAMAYNQLGVLAIQQNDLHAAERFFASAADFSPENPGFRKNLEVVRKLLDRGGVSRR